MKRGKQMSLFDNFDNYAAAADSAHQQRQQKSVEPVIPTAPTEVPPNQCTGPLFCPRCGTPYNWESAGEFCTCGARRCLTCGDG